MLCLFVISCCQQKQKNNNNNKKTNKQKKPNKQKKKCVGNANTNSVVSRSLVSCPCGLDAVVFPERMSHGGMKFDVLPCVCRSAQPGAPRDAGAPPQLAGCAGSRARTRASAPGAGASAPSPQPRRFVHRTLDNGQFKHQTLFAT